MQIQTTKDKSSATLNLLVHGLAGSGKTRLASTVSKPIVLSAEGGLLSLREFDIPFLEITDTNQIDEAMNIAMSGDYEWIFIDSLSELCEMSLAKFKRVCKDARMAYGMMADEMSQFIRDVRDCPKNVCFTAKQGKVKDDASGMIFHGVSAPGEKFAQAISYFFDEVFCLHTMKDADGNTESMLQTQRCTQYDAKDRSGSLNMWETPNLTAIYNKIYNTN